MCGEKMSAKMAMGKLRKTTELFPSPHVIKEKFRTEGMWQYFPSALPGLHVVFRFLT